MKKAKRIIGLVLMLVVAITATFTGCGKIAPAASPAATSPAASSSSANAATPAATLPPAKLVWVLPMNPQKDLELVEQEISKYTTEKINATVDLQVFDFGTYKDKSNVMIAAGDYMDIVFTSSTWNYRQNATKGAFVDITDMIDTYTPKTKAELHPALFEGSKVGGRNYAIPTQKELAHTFGLVYRADIAEKHSIDMSNVKSYADLEPILQTVKEKEPEMYPLQGFQRLDPTWFMDFDPIGDSNSPGHLYPNKDTTVVNKYATPEAKEYFALQRKYYLAGYIRQDAAAISDKSPDEKGGKNFIQVGFMKPLNSEDAGIANGFKYGQIDLTPPYIGANDTQGSLNAVSRTSKNVERSLMLLELVNTDAYLNNTINYGIENKHYVKKSENIVDYAPGLDAKTTGYFPNIFWVVGNQFKNYLMTTQNPKKWDLYKEFNASGTMSKIMGFGFDPEPVKTELAACENVRVEYMYALGTGSVDPEVYLPKFLDKLKEVGVDKIIAEKQRQIDTWLASKK